MKLDIGNYIMHDWLSIYFSLIIIIIFIPIFIYSIGYVQEYKKRYSTSYLWGMMIFFVISMLGVVLSSNSLSFLIFWELMSVSSFFLVIYEHDNKENIKSGIMYFIMTHISGLLLILMFIILAKYSGSLNFMNLINGTHNFTAIEKYIILFLALLGFGAKAGLIPMHAWLPKAHPSAPSNISALMSGVMLKIALYGFIRVVFMFVGDIPIYFSMLIMVSGAVTAIYSVINAIMQEDIKKLLAYSSVENIGMIFSTLGLSMLLEQYGQHALSVLALAAALFHILNHGVFKSLLFVGAGSVLFSTGTKNMNELGGLHKKIKFTAFCVFIGTAAICAIPPLNGFASEILIFKSFIEAGTAISNPLLILLVLFSGILLAVTSGGVMWASVKSFGITFLGAPRTEKAVKTHKIPVSMNFGMAILTAYTIILGIISPVIISWIYKEVSKFTGLTGTVYMKAFSFEISIISLLLIIVGFTIYIFLRFIRRNEKKETYETWACGFNEIKPFMQYSASGFSQPVAKFTGNITLYKKEVVVKDTIFLKQKVGDFIETHLYSRIIAFFDFVASKIIKIHHGKIQAYVSYIFFALLVAIVLVMNFI